MNSKLVLAVLLVVLGLTHADHEEDDKKMFEECKKETNATEDYDKVMKEKVAFTSEGGNCMTWCMLKRKGIYVNKMYDDKSTREYITNKYAGDPEKMKAAMDLADKCGKIDVSGLDHCEAANKQMKCAHDAHKQ